MIFALDQKSKIRNGTKTKINIWKFWNRSRSAGNIPKSAKPGEPSEPLHNKLCENCKETSRITIPGANILDHPSRTIREKFCSRAVEKRTPAENLIKFKVWEKFLKIRFREKVGGFKIVYKVFKENF